MGEHLYLAHHGIKGMKWGVRRFQNTDGSLTSAGKKRYGIIDSYRSDFKAIKGDLRAYGNARNARKAAKKKYWQREDDLETSHENQVMKIHDAEDSGKITKKEANRQYHDAWKEYSKASDKSGAQYKADKREIKTKRIEEQAQRRMNESKRIQKEYKDTLRARSNSDYHRGNAMVIKSRADVRRAKDAYRSNKTPETRRAYHRAVAKRAILVNYSVVPSTIGAYDRYRENGASAVTAALKAGTLGSVFKHSDS